MKQELLGAGLVLLMGCQFVNADAPSCTFTRVPVISTDAKQNEYYVARGRAFAIQFQNEDAPNPAKVFPEPKVIIANTGAHSRCEITGEPGIWSGDDVYLNDAESVVLLNEYGGSNAFLKLFDTATCGRIAELDVSGKLWKISGSTLLTGAHCSGDTVETCLDKSTISLNAYCRATKKK